MFAGGDGYVYMYMYYLYVLGTRRSTLMAVNVCKAAAWLPRRIPMARKAQCLCTN